MNVGCQSIMCKYNIQNREDAKEFLIRNHPDKNSDFPKAFRGNPYAEH